MSTEMAVDTVCVVSMRSWHQNLLFSCITKQPEADSFIFTRSNGAYCVTTLVVMSWYRAVEPRYLRYRGSKMYRELHGIGTVKNGTAVENIFSRICNYVEWMNVPILRTADLRSFSLHLLSFTSEMCGFLIYNQRHSADFDQRSASASSSAVVRSIGSAINPRQ